MSYVLCQIGRLYRSLLLSLKLPELFQGKCPNVTLNYTEKQHQNKNSQVHVSLLFTTDRVTLPFF